MIYPDKLADQDLENEINRLVERYFGQRDVMLHVEPDGKVQVIKGGKVVGEQG